MNLVTQRSHHPLRLGGEPLEKTSLEVMEAVLWAHSLSRSTLLGRLECSKSKLGSTVAELLDAGLLEEVGLTSSSGGRKAEMLSIHPGLGVLLAVDLGATHLNMALLSPNLGVLCHHHEALDVRLGPSAGMARIKAVLKLLLAQQGLSRSSILAVGMGVPGPVDFGSGLLVHPPIMPGWEGFSVRDDLASTLEAPVFVDNDVNVLALAELWQRQRFAQNFIVVKVSTGIGCGIVCAGQIYRGSNGAAGDVGHICVDPLGPLCHCGNAGCVEAMAAGPALARNGQRAAEQGESRLLAEYLQAGEAITVQQVGRASREGDAVASALIQRSGKLVGQMLASLVNFFNPSHIVLAGGLTRLGPLWLASIRQSVYRRSLPLSTRHLDISLSALEPQGGSQGNPQGGQQGGLIGAGVLGLLSCIRSGGDKL